MTITAPPRPPEGDQLEALIEEARRRARRRRRGYAAALMVIALVGVTVYVLVVRGAGGSRSPTSPPTNAASAPQGFRPGRFWYTRTVTTWRPSRPAGGEYQAKVFMRSRGPMVAFIVRVSGETWVGIDGTTRQRVVVLSRRFASSAGRSHWSAYHRPLPNFARDIDTDSITLGDGRFPASNASGDPLGPQDIGDGAFNYGQLRSLPTWPVALRTRIERAFQALQGRQANSAVDRCGFGAATGCRAAPPGPAWQRRESLASLELTELAQMLSWPVPERLRLALFRSATTLAAVSSDVTVNAHAHDALGRPGVAVTASPSRYPGHYEPDPMRLIFNPTSGALLAQPGFGGQGIVTAQGVAESMNQPPKGVDPVHTSTAPPEPPQVWISPTVGTPNTVFTVTVAAPPRASVSSHDPRLGGAVRGPVYRGCSSGFSTPTPPSPLPFLSFPGTTRSHGGRLVYVYRLKPPAGTGDSWCAGRYQLQLDTSGPGPPGPSGAGIGIYFEVK